MAAHFQEPKYSSSISISVTSFQMEYFSLLLGKGKKFLVVTVVALLFVLQYKSVA